jgi:hypothetical protein
MVHISPKKFIGIKRPRILRTSLFQKCKLTDEQNAPKTVISEQHVNLGVS